MKKITILISLFILFTAQLTSAQVYVDTIGAGSALEFNSTAANYVNLGPVYKTFNFPFSFEAWVYPTSVPSLNAGIFSLDNTTEYYGWWAAQTYTGQFDVSFGNSYGFGYQYRRGFNTLNNLPLNQWTHIAVVSTSVTNVTIYFNGVLQSIEPDDGASTDTIMTHSTDGVASIGEIWTVPTYDPFDGQIDEVRLWSDTLAQTDIQQNMCRKIAPNTPGLLGYWRFDEASTNDTAYDYTGNGVNGILEGTVPRDISDAPFGNASAYLYNANWNTATLSLGSATGDSLMVSQLSGNPNGVQVYAVNSQPYYTSGLVKKSNSYFGVFCVNGTSPAYTATYKYSLTDGTINSSNQAYASLADRIDASDTPWTLLNGNLNTSNHTISKTDQPSPKEYILDTGTCVLSFSVFPQSQAICAGSSITIGTGSQLVLPDSASQNDLLDSNNPTTNYDEFYEIDAWHWTNSGNTTIGRSLIRYDLSSIPAGSTILSASLSLYGDSLSDEDNGGSYSSTSNASYLQLLTSAWNPSTVTWNTQPDTITTDEVYLPMSTSEWEDYLDINVTALISDLYNNPSTYTGLMLRLQDENPVYNGLIFGSSYNADTHCHPKLVINYTNSNKTSDTTYTWSPSAGLSATTGVSVIANPTVTTTYTITAKNSSGCTGTQTVVITVNPTPTVSVTPSPASYCDGGSSVLTASGSNFYSWSPVTALSDTTGAVVTANPSTTTTYTVTGTDSGGCTATNTVTVAVNPTPTITAMANPPYYCRGGISTITASGGDSYSWFPTTGLSAATGQIVGANPTVTTTYVVIGTNLNGCQGSTTVILTVDTSNITASANPTSFCVNGSSILTALGGSTYNWSPATGLSDTTGNRVIASPTVTTTYTLDGTTAAGCTGATSIVVTVNPNPTITVSPPTSICYGDTALLISGGGTTYTWSPSGGLSATSGNSIIATPSVTTTYTVNGTDSLGCTGSASDIVSVTSPPDTPTITQHKDTLISSAKQGNQWIRNDSTLQGATNQTYIITISGNYKVVTSNPANGCSSTSAGGYYTPTGINQLTVESGKVTVYPNPTGGEIFVNISSLAMDVRNWNLQVTDELGRTVYTLSSLDYTNDIDLSNLTDGMYFICVINKTGRVVLAVVKQ